MRFYHYISDSKLEMLFPQIPPKFLGGLKVELGFDFGLLKGKLAGENTSPAGRIAQAQAVERYLEEKCQIVETAEQHVWLRGSFSARIGFLTGCPGLVLIGGEYQGATLLLAGSESHLLSGSTNPGKDKGWSFMPRLLSGLRDYLNQGYDTLDLTTEDRIKPAEVAFDYIFGGKFGSGSSMRFALHRLPEESLPPPNLPLKFLARIFFASEKGGDEKLLLGSPVYVADDAEC